MKSNRPGRYRFGNLILQGGSAAAACLLVTAALASPPATRVVAVGDVHGDAATLTALLQHTHLIDANQRWTGGDAVFVQTGDYLDRGPDVRHVMDLLMSLEEQARRARGRAVILMGNHEAMNAMGDLRDVAPEAFEQFVDSKSERRRETAWRDYLRLTERRRSALVKVNPEAPVPDVYNPPIRETWMQAHPPGWLEYREAFGPRGKYGKWLRKRRVVEQIGDTVFVHGGLDPEFSTETLDRLNDRAKDELELFDRLTATMVREGIALPFFTFEELLEAGRSELARMVADSPDTTQRVGPQYSEDRRLLERFELVKLLKMGEWSILSPQGPLWFRGFARLSPEEGGPMVDRLQQTFGPVRFVVGHTQTEDRRIAARFDGRVFLIDTALSSAYADGTASALEIDGDRYTAITQQDRQVLLEAAEARN